MPVFCEKQNLIFDVCKVAGIVDPAALGYQDMELPPLPPDGAPPFLNKLAMLIHQKNGKKGSHSSSKPSKSMKLIPQIVYPVFVGVTYYACF